MSCLTYISCLSVSALLQGQRGPLQWCHGLVCCRVEGTCALAGLVFWMSSGGQKWMSGLGERLLWRIAVFSVASSGGSKEPLWT